MSTSSVIVLGECQRTPLMMSTLAQVMDRWHYPSQCWPGSMIPYMQEPPSPFVSLSISLPLSVSVCLSVCLSLSLSLSFSRSLARSLAHSHTHTSVWQKCSIELYMYYVFSFRKWPDDGKAARVSKLISHRRNKPPPPQTLLCYRKTTITKTNIGLMYCIWFLFEIIDFLFGCTSRSYAPSINASNSFI